MIGRVAEALFWIGRYTERIDCHARLINASFHTFQEWSGCQDERSRHWQSLLSTLGEAGNYLATYQTWDEKQVLYFMTLDAEHANSMISCLKHARHNIRSVRERLPDKLWESINNCYFWLHQPEALTSLQAFPYMFYQELNNRMALSAGIISSSMLRQNEWHLVQMGTYIERAENTIRLLEMEYNTLSQVKLPAPVIYQKLLSLFQAVDGFEAFRKFYADDITPDNAFDFLLLNPFFPRSVIFCFYSLEQHFNTLQTEDPAFKQISGRIIKMMQKTKMTMAGLEQELYQNGQLPELLTFLRQQCNELSEEIGRTFFREGTHIA